MDNKNTDNNQASNQNRGLTNKEWQILIVKILAAILLVLLCYFGLEYYINNKINNLKSGTTTSSSDDEIFDLSDEYKNNDGVNYTIDDNSQELTVEELKKDKGRLIYKTLIKNQIAIRDLSQEIYNLKQDLEHRKNQEQIIRIIYTYCDLRQKLFAGQNYDDELKSFELLTVNNDFLKTKYISLEGSLKDFKSSKNLLADFKNLIPQIIAAQNSNPDASFIQKIKFNLSKLIVIRRITNPEIDDLDGNLLQIENAITDESYGEALELIAKISDPSYKFLEKFLANLNAASDVKQTDAEILFYLKEIASSK
jgi:hypothetical protein